MSHIIIEGTDNTGKTTLAIELAKRLYMPIINRLYPRDTIFEECLEILASPKPYIIDRMFISELVYGKVKRGHSRLSQEEIQVLEQLAKSKKTFNIFCTGKIADIKERCVRENETFIKGQEIDEVQKGFEKEIGESGLSWHYYQIGDDIDIIANKVKERWNISNIKNYDRY